MGMYTSLRACVAVKPEYQELAMKFASYSIGAEDIERYPFLKDYYKNERAESIPNGNVSDDYVIKKDEAAFKNHFDAAINRWFFSSYLKNYEDDQTGLTPIAAFMDGVIVNIVEKIYLFETKFEDDAFLRQYDFNEEKSQVVGVQTFKTNPYGHLSEVWGMTEERYEEECKRIDQENKDYFQAFKQELHLSYN
ncbi:hypothetical protein HCB27_14470 [Listeria booriae]|uniref:Uncharacterized protein n=1 Tax=Listeria booriae TaxID=1552123 RepID=A0A7X0Z8A5_9LIST|nr:hypothetical protein [Listeria booriae]MBC2177748.1 hypothetical protein [Listeria booriae]MBC2177831.1 hypothetical protein [Listeria booriae]